MGIGPVIIRNWHGFACPATALGDMLGFMLYVLGTCMGHHGHGHGEEHGN